MSTTSPPDPRPRAALRVLVVDDEPDARRLVRAICTRLDADVDVTEASSGDQAVELARQLLPDLVLLDINMPEGSGIDALPHLRRAAPSARIWMFSSDGPRRAEAMEAGADNWLEKSQGIGEISRRIEELASAPRGAQTTDKSDE